MSRESFRIAVAACLLLLALAGGQVVQGEEPPAQDSTSSGQTEANGTVSLRDDRGAEGPRSSSTPAPSAVADDEAAESKPAVVIAPPSGNELRPLGQPNGSLSVRPARDPDAAGGATSMDAYVPGSIRVVGALLVVIGLIFATRWAMRKAGGLGRGERPSGVLEVLARYPVARGQQLVLLKFARRILLVHQTGTTMSILTELNEQNEVASLLGRIEAGSRGQAAARFGSLLKRFQAEHEPSPADPAAAISATRTSTGISTGTSAATEIVDLTRRSGGFMSRMTGGRR